MINTSVDYSNGASCILQIKHYTENRADTTILNAMDEDYVSNWIIKNIGEQLHRLNGCPIYMELSGLANIYAGADYEEYSLDNYPDINASEWEITLLNRSEQKDTNKSGVKGLNDSTHHFFCYYRYELCANTQSLN